MGASCSLHGYVKREDGQVVISKLWTDLMKYSGNNRNVTKEYWKNFHKGGYLEQNLKDMLGDKAKFDENGEFTFGTLHQYTGMTEIGEKELSQSLLAEIPKGEKTFDEAMAFLKEFRENSQFAEEFMPTFTVNKKGKCELAVVPKNEANALALDEQVRKLSVKERILYYLQRSGVAVDFIDKGNSQYTTENIDKAADGMYHLISILNGEESNVEEALAEEAGHFAFAAMGNHALAERLLSILQNEETRNEILNELDPEHHKELGYHPDREIAGALIGKALQNELKHDSAWARLANRIVNFLKKAFYNLTGQTVKAAIVDARIQATQIAQGFKSHHFNGNIENALEFKETRNQAISHNKEVFELTQVHLRGLVAQLKPINYKMAKEVEQLLLEIQEAGTFSKGTSEGAASALANQSYLAAITVATAKLLSLMMDVEQNLAKIDPSVQDVESIAQAQYIRSAQQCISTASIVYHLIERYLPKANETKDRKVLTGDLTNVEIATTRGKLSYNLQGLLDSLNHYLTDKEGLESTVNQVAGDYAIHWMEGVLGSAYVERGRRLVRERSKDGRMAMVAKMGKKEYISDLIHQLPEDVSWINTYITSANVSTDVIVQIYNKAVAQAHRLKTYNSNKAIDDLRALKQECKDLLGSANTDWMFERDEKGKKTGNLLTLETVEDEYGNQYETILDYGKWERDWEEHKEELYKEFEDKYLKHNPQWTPSIARAKRRVFFQEKREEWDKQNSLYVEREKDGKMVTTVIPNRTYQNWDAIKALSDKQKNILRKMNALKASIDNKYLGLHGVKQRAPQFHAQTLERFSRASVFKKAFKGLKETFWNDLNDDDFGSDYTDTQLEDSAYPGINLDSDEEAQRKEDKTIVEKEEELYKKKSKIKKFWNNLWNKGQTHVEVGEVSPSDKVRYTIESLPLYGIKKMKDTDDISTDLFHTMAVYVDMATTYDAHKQVVNDMELTLNYMTETRGTPNQREGEKKSIYDTTRSYKQIRKLIDVQLYNKRYGEKSNSLRGLFKFVGALTGLAAVAVLRWNVKGGMVNTGTGIIELFKEAMTGEDFTLKNLLEAHKTYFQYMIPSLGGGYMEELITLGNSDNAHFGRDKLSLMIRYFDMLGKNESVNQEWFTSGWKNKTGVFQNLVNIYGKTALSPYGSGEHYMQTISFLCVFKNHKLYKYDPDTGKVKQIVLEDIYDVVKENGIARLQRRSSDIVLKDNSKEAIEDYERLKRFQDLIADYKERNEEIGSVDEPILSEEDKEWCKKHYPVASREMVIDMLGIIAQKEKDRLCFQLQDEVNLIQAARRKVNDMHGLYDKQNKAYIQTEWYSSALMAMKGYALGYMQRKASTANYNITLQREDEGAWTTMLKVCLGPFTHLYREEYVRDADGNIAKDAKGDPIIDQTRTFEMSSACIFASLLHSVVNFIQTVGVTFGISKSKNYLRNNYGLSEHQLKNIKRFYIDQIVGLTLAGFRILLLIKKIGKTPVGKVSIAIPLAICNLGLSAFGIAPMEGDGDDDDDDEEEDQNSFAYKKWRWLYYFVGRLDAEQNSYNPTSLLYMLQEFQGITSTTPLAISVLSQWANIIYRAVTAPDKIESKNGDTFDVKELLSSSEANEDIVLSTTKEDDRYYGTWDQLKDYYKRDIEYSEAAGKKVKKYKYTYRPLEDAKKYTILRNQTDWNNDPVKMLDGYFWGRERK